MVKLACATAICQCSFGQTPALFMPKPKSAMEESKIAGDIMDILPTCFIPISQPVGPPFGACRAPTNPVMIATKGAVPGICSPFFSMPWMPGSTTVGLSGIPALLETSILMCNAYKGVITIKFPGETTIIVPS